MENSLCIDLAMQDLTETLPTLIKYISANEVAGFDTITLSGFKNQHQPTDNQSLSSSAMANGTAALEDHIDGSKPGKHPRTHSVSISMPTTPIGDSSKDTRRVIFKDSSETIPIDPIPDSSVASKTSGKPSKGKKFYSQPMPKGRPLEELGPVNNFPNHPSVKRLKGKRYDPFKTWSGKLERRITNLRGKPRPEASLQRTAGGQKTEKEALPVDRYFDALEGPELETLGPSEEIVLPEDKKWPFLLRYPVSPFGICLGVSSQVLRISHWLWRSNGL